jgi:choline dehydrogenase
VDDSVTGKEEFDYIVAGAGTAGCVIATRLTEDPGTRVLLVEAGSGERSRAMTDPPAWPELLGTAAEWQETTVPQADAGPLPYPRGRTLGGSGAINAMAHFRGHHAVYDTWPCGWGYADLLPYFRSSKITTAPVPENQRHPFAQAFAAALPQEGVSWPDLAITLGQRVSAADAYLRPALSRPNLTVRTDCLVTRLLIETGRCRGISYLDHGTVADARASREVIACAGAIGTPKLLMLSGIGPARHLRALGIDPAVDLPAVGHNLQDHPVVMVCRATGSPVPRSRYNHGEVYATVRSPSAGTWPDLQLFPILLPVAPPGHRAPPAGYALTASVVAPDSSGTVRLADADPFAAPLIDPGFLREPVDLDRLVAGVEMIRAAAAQAGLPGEEIHPGTTGLRSYIRRAVGSYWHPAGTCRMGSGATAVVDPDLRVRGIDGLRVADASVMPVIPNAPLNATVLAIAEKAARVILGRRQA